MPAAIRVEKQMCHNVLAFVLIVSLCDAGEGQGTVNTNDSTATKSMMSFLASNSVVSFVAECKRQYWSAPVMHSQMRVDRLVNLRMKMEEQLKRDFGLIILRNVTQAASQIENAKSGETCASVADAVLALGNWVASTRGYGNQIIGWRCYDVACIGYIKTISDSSFCATGIEHRASALEAPWQEPRDAADILNEEAGTALFIVTNATADQRASTLAQTWIMGTITYNYVRKNGDVDMLMLKLYPDTTNRVNPSGYHKKYPTLYTNRLFFASLSVSNACTTESDWNLQCHYRIASPCVTRFLNRRLVVDLAAIRGVIGYLPTNKPPIMSCNSTIASSFIYELNKRTSNDVLAGVYKLFRLDWA